MTTKTEEIRALNDNFRHNFSGGRALLTPGIAALGAETVSRIVQTVAVFDDFCHANDPYQEHDFGSFEADGHTIFFKIDYYDKALNFHSPDPADPSVTERVITIMLANEYRRRSGPIDLDFMQKWRAVVNANALSKLDPSSAIFTPGHLMSPFDWVAPWLIAQIQDDPQLATGVLALNRSQMHLVALAFAIAEDSQPVQISALLSLPYNETLSQLGGTILPGAKRLLTKLPPTVLSRQGYKALVALLSDPMSVAALGHLADHELSDLTIRALYELPAAIRPMLVRLVPSVQRLDHLPDGLLHLVSRGAAPTFDDLVADLASQKQPSQFTARLRTLVDGLPLPQMLPPARIGTAKRIDGPIDLRALGSAFKNCLASLTCEVDAGSCAIYLWNDPAAPALSRLIRHGRFGWVHESSLGPHNKKLSPQHLRQLIASFAELGIPQFSATRTIERIMRATIRSARQQERERAWIEGVIVEIEDDAV